MTCPKCQSKMRTVDKNGVHIDQCEGCRGIFLDRGELEQIAKAETAFYAAAPPPYRPDSPAPHGGHGRRQGHPDSPRPHRGGHPDSPRGYRAGYADSPRPHRGGHPDSPRGYRGGYADSPRPHRGGYADSPRPYGHGGHKGHRKRSFLDGLFD
ncbi:transcriptional regulator [Amycolatopsis antarctica]|uniref:Transcriptional regulator n=1 Tax=Amycolatopsis antarctica TaxID=1854586 RepID=A0A263CVN0_9PSEU|nr:zf-TFIIB domain-containing protein [Amycolatopsis antarctica]OZM70184.1 transcriptional regulator [Amycolatopsis antarctica]